MSRAAAQRSPAHFHASVLRGAKPASFPGFIEPCHPMLREKAPSGARWIHETKFDGYRMQVHLHNGRPAMYTRRGDNWTLRFGAIADALAALPANNPILDGAARSLDAQERRKRFGQPVDEFTGQPIKSGVSLSILVHADFIRSAGAVAAVAPGPWPLR